MHCLKKKQCDGAQELQLGYSLFLLPGSIKQTKKKQWERAEQNYLSQFSLLPNSNYLPGGNSNLAEKKKKPPLIRAESFLWSGEMGHSSSSGGATVRKVCPWCSFNSSLEEL